jgi:DNA polymerase-3 subunit alpha (Gram-positive type)
MLGHVDPVALKMMCDITNINIKDIPMNDPEVLAIFSKVDSLKLHNNYLNQTTGALAIPEFGTDFVRGILEKTRPQTFSDLVIISGLSHGTNVWNGNAETIIDNKTATLQEVIGCRDDIMTYLIGKGLDSPIAFAIMEDVRKGRGLKPEYEQAMIVHNVPQYYIESCKKIKYMFPKGHAVAYVTMAIRVGYFKVHYPLEFYATFFSVRSKQYDIIPMIKGEEAIINRLEQLKVKEKTLGEKLTTKEEEQYKTLQIAVEMTQRGYKFSNIDLYRSDATKFVVDHEHNCLIPPFTTIDGLGENNAITVIEERQKRPFTSKEDLLRRTKLTSTNVNDLSAMGVLDSLSESDQLSLFDF